MRWADQFGVGMGKIRTSLLSVLDLRCPLCVSAVMSSVRCNHRGSSRRESPGCHGSCGREFSWPGGEGGLAEDVRLKLKGEGGLGPGEGVVVGLRREKRHSRQCSVSDVVCVQ